MINLLAQLAALLSAQQTHQQAQTEQANRRASSWMRFAYDERDRGHPVDAPIFEGPPGIVSRQNLPMPQLRWKDSRMPQPTMERQQGEEYLRQMHPNVQFIEPELEM